MISHRYKQIELAVVRESTIYEDRLHTRERLVKKFKLRTFGKLETNEHRYISHH